MYNYRMKWIPDPPEEYTNIDKGENQPPAFGCLLKTRCISNPIG